VSLTEINERFTKACPDCVVTIKKDSADYIVRFAASQGWSKKSWSWIVYENRDGTMVKQGDTSLFNNSLKDADLHTLTESEKVAFFTLWSERGNLDKLAGEVQKHPAWLQYAWFGLAKYMRARTISAQPIN